MLTYQYFEVIKMPKMARRKTCDYEIIKSSGAHLGRIAWYGAWRKYCFFPCHLGDTVWSAGCLNDVIDAIKKIEAERKKGNG